MEISTKASIGDTIYYLHDNRLHSADVHAVRVCQYSGKIPIGDKGYRFPITVEDVGIWYYTVHGMFSEDKVFLSKKDLANDLMRE